MIARLRNWLRHTDELAAARAEIRQLNKALADAQSHSTGLGERLTKEQMLTAGFTSAANDLMRQLAAAKLRADSAEAIAARLRADHTYVTAERCECGGDTELHWRREAAAAQAQAGRDRANAVALTDEVERLRLIADEAERLHHIVEQLERAR